jgi:hypothetical protein
VRSQCIDTGSIPVASIMEEETPTPPVEEPVKVKGSTRDGPRYVVSLQTEKDPCCHKDFYETEKLHEAQERAKREFEKVGRRVLLYDRKICSIIERYESEAKPAEEKKPEPKRRGRRK